MTWFIRTLAAALLFSAGTVFAAERTVTLKVDNITCALCGPTVKKALTQVPGVARVEVLTGKNTATVTFDDAKASVEALIAATANAGYPSRLAN
jgi:mercuric ion binding protein